MQNQIFAAIDTQDPALAAGLTAALTGVVSGVKIGLEFFNANGPDGVRRIANTGVPFFLDLKFHDIPNTVAGAIRAAVSLKPAILNVHASGGAAMMKAAATAITESADALGVVKPMLIAVTVLTSLDDDDLAAVGQRGVSEEQVVRLAKLTEDCGLDGVVCSPLEIRAIRAACNSEFKLVVPGIRPAGTEAGDQKRTMTPTDAINAGADYLIIGRPITAADDPAKADRAIAATITP